MISSDEQYNQALMAERRVENALIALRKRVEPINPELFQAMAQSYIKEIEEIRNEINEYVGISSAEMYKAPLWLSLEGKNLRVSEISTKLLTLWLDKFRKAVTTVAEFLENGQLALRTPLSIITKTDPKIVALQPGSIRIGIKYPDEIFEDTFFDNQEIPVPISHKAVNRLLEMVSIIQTKDTESLQEKFPDENETSIIINQLSSLVPSNKSTVTCIKFLGSMVPSSRSLYLIPDSKNIINEIRASLTVIHEDEVIGVIREIDLDAPRIILRERVDNAPDLKCLLSEDMITTAEELLSKKVKIRGSMSSADPYTVNVISIEPLET